MFCEVCNTEFEPKTRRARTCSRKCSKTGAARRWRANHPEAAADVNLKRNYGISFVQYETLLSRQNSRCAVCGVQEPGGQGRWHVDHDHASGKIRGLLCVNCNVGLGHFSDSTERLTAAISYLAKNTPCKLCQYEDWPLAQRWDFVIKGKLQSQNTIGANGRGYSGARYRAIRRRYEIAVTSASIGIPKATGFRRVFITRRFAKGCRLYDHANLVGGCKPLIDALSKEKLLVDDSPKWCSTYFVQLPSGTTKDYIEIVLEERGE